MFYRLQVLAVGIFFPLLFVHALFRVAHVAAAENNKRMLKRISFAITTEQRTMLTVRKKNMRVQRLFTQTPKFLTITTTTGT